MNTLEEQARLRAAFELMSAINALDGCPCTDDMREIEERIITGEITFDEAVQEIIDELHKRNYSQL